MAPGVTHRLVIGPGGTGRSHRLRAWVAALDDSDQAHWLTGRMRRAPDEAAVKAAVAAAAASGAVLVIDDLQWFGEDALDRLITAVDDVTIWASRRPWPTSPNLRVLDDVLTEQTGAERVGLLSPDDFAPAATALTGSATATERIERWHAATAGSVGLAADAVAAGWDGELSSVPEELVDAVVGRVERSGTAGAALARVLALAPDVDVAVAADALDERIKASDAQRGIRAGGLVDSDGHLIPLVQTVVVADLTVDERQELHDRLGLALRARHPAKAIDHLLAGTGTVAGVPELIQSVAATVADTDPDEALAIIDRALDQGMAPEGFALSRAKAAFNNGSEEALALLATVPVEQAADAELLGLALDVRALRLEAAASRPVDGALGAALARVAGAMVGRPDVGAAGAGSPAGPAGPDGPDGAGPHLDLINRVVDGLFATAAGNHPEAHAAFTASADDNDRLRPVRPLGMSPHAIGALAAQLGGDVAAAGLLLDQAIANNSGGVGEIVTHRLLLAYAGLVEGQFSEALTAVRVGEESDWTQRDRLLLAVLDAAIARRSGDTTRLREAWRRADPVLARQTTGWLLIDPLTELLAAGARIGDSRRIDPVIDRLVADASALPAQGPGPVAAQWLCLQVALARDDDAGVRSAATALAELEPAGERARRRVEAAGCWVAILDKTVDEAQLAAVADGLVATGDRWEASRLLGQAALDHEDPKAARRLLEAARSLMSEIVDHEDGDGLVALGLSERETDVARLVAEGRTYKEIGSQLFISPKTVEHHVARIRQKLGASSRAEFLSIVREAIGE